ncbi:hypothetical protein GQ457_03G006070 [Hibiscus cannabinus]
MNRYKSKDKDKDPGGLLSSWDPNVINISDKIITSRSIILIGEIISRNLKIGLVNVYGPSIDSDKRDFFAELSNLTSSYDIPWVIGGDFNAYLHPDEKSGSKINKLSIGIFKEFVHHVRGIDLPLLGGSFTWCNNRDPPPTFVRLDRFIVTANLLSVFPSISQTLLPKALSDHNAILLQSESQNWGQKPFKFFNFWFDKEGFDDLVNDTVRSRRSSGHKRGIGGLLNDSKMAIKAWAKINCTDSKTKISNLESQIHEMELKIQSGGSKGSNMGCLLKLKSALWNLYREEEREWLQKSRLRWFSEGDRNTRFFHLTASIRQKKNEISTLSIGDMIYSKPEAIKECVKAHFHFAYNNSHALEVESMNLPFKRLNTEQRLSLESEFYETEVWEVIRDFDGNRAPGPDGFNMNFFKRYWDLLKEDIMKFFSDVYLHRNWDANLNHSFLTLIPKKRNPSSLEDYRPISLVNGVYKILAKVLGNRLRKYMDCLISKTQFAFIPGRQILDCSLIANEVIDTVRKSGSKGIAFKIDFKKAYDSIDWKFLLLIMENMGFGERWVFKCISTVSISVLVNGSPTGRFNISRGLRQGCPLSPLLFNLVGEALSLMLGKSENLGLFSGIKIGRNVNSVTISHLQFADDLMVFSDAEESQVLAVQRVLRVFELASGLQINFKKS